MATCGIKKYDKLPGRVGFIDVDALRFALNKNVKQKELIINKLEESIKKYKMKNKKVQQEIKNV